MKFRVDYYAVVTVHAVREVEAESWGVIERRIEFERGTQHEANVLRSLKFELHEPITSETLSGVDVLHAETKLTREEWQQLRKAVKS